MGDLDATMSSSGGFAKSQTSNATLRGQKVSAANMKAPKSVLETVPIQGQRVIEHRDDFVELSETLDWRIDALLQEHGNDFYLAYRAHMYTVQQVLYDLRQQASAQERNMANDERIRNLERELEWFMTEALRLDHLAKVTDKAVEKWRVKAKELEQHKKFHSDQVKGHKRLNKVLNLATDHPAPSSTEWPASPGDGGSLSARGSPRKKQLALSPKATDLLSPGKKQMQVLSPQSARSATSSVTSPQVSPGRPSPAGSPGMKFGAMSARGVGSSPPLANEREAWYVDTIKDLQEKVKKQQRETRMLKCARSGSFTQKHQLEEFFLKCVSEARKDVDRGQRLFCEKDRVRSEKEKIAETLLSSENAMVFIYEQIFPHRVGTTRHCMEGDRHLGVVSSEILSSAKQSLPPLE